MEHTIGGARRKTLELLVQLARTKQREHHQLVEIGAAAFDAGLFADHGVAAVAADRIVGLQDFAFAAAVLGDGDAHAVIVLLDRLRDPAEPRVDIAELCHARAQHIFALVLRQSLIVLEIV